MTPRERRDLPWLIGAFGFLLGFCAVQAMRYFGG